MPEITKSVIAEAIARGWFELHYQPIVDARNAAYIKIRGFEALARLNYGGQLLPPAAFLPAVGEFEMAVAFGDWVIESAVAQARRWSNAGVIGAHPIAINISDEQFSDTVLVARIRARLWAVELHESMIELEISESATLFGDMAHRQVREMQRCGLVVVLDDVGTGNTHLHVLADLADLGVRTLKIDRQYVSGCTQRGGGYTLRKMVELARDLGMHVIAEGVENEAQALFLRQHNCNVMQGYYFARPMSVADVERYMVRRD